jgi:diacylglycerol kinase (ATP)
MENNNRKFSIEARLRSFVYAFHGLANAFRHEPNIRIHSVAAIAAITLGFILHISANEWLAVIIVIAGVIASEIFNSAIEGLTDLLSPEISKKAGVIKDMAAGAVSIAALGALIVGLLIFLPKVF